MKGPPCRATVDLLFPLAECHGHPGLGAVPRRIRRPHVDHAALTAVWHFPVACEWRRRVGAAERAVDEELDTGNAKVVARGR